MRQFPTVNNLSMSDIQGALLKIHECPVLGHRFKNVPDSRVLNMLNETLYVLREIVETGDLMASEPFLNLHILMHIKEEEIDAYFKYFMDECNIEGNEINKEYWKYLNMVKKQLLNYEIGNRSIKEFSGEPKENLEMKEHFSVLLSHTNGRIVPQIFAVLESEDPENQFHDLIQKHRQRQITEEQFDELSNQFLKVHIPNDDYNTSKLKEKLAMLKKLMIKEVTVVDLHNISEKV